MYITSLFLHWGDNLSYGKIKEKEDAKRKTDKPQFYLTRKKKKKRKKEKTRKRQLYDLATTT